MAQANETALDGWVASNEQESLVMMQMRKWDQQYVARTGLAEKIPTVAQRMEYVNEMEKATREAAERTLKLTQ